MFQYTCVLNLMMISASMDAIIFALSNNNLFTHLKNIVKIPSKLLFLFRFYKSLHYYQSATLLVGFSC